jgi:2-oxoglutarate ferredoxin oxidoreductase subunit beta
MTNFDTYAENTWCAGCGNFLLLKAVKEAWQQSYLGKKSHKLVIVSGIGCHGKIVDYLNVNSFYSIHGRVPSTATGIKIANPDLTVIGFAGDGDAYGEGLAHLIFAAKRNIDITMIVHNNRVYALTTGQFTPTSPRGFKGKSTPQGSIESPFNPLLLMFYAHATFIARGYAGRPQHLVKILTAAFQHKGFSFVDVLQPCISFYNTYSIYNQRVWEIKNKASSLSDAKKALNLMKKWDYNDPKVKIPIGIFYQVKKPTYEQILLKGQNLIKKKTRINWSQLLNQHV